MGDGFKVNVRTGTGAVRSVEARQGVRALPAELRLVRLEVRYMNIAAQKLYESLGYSITQRLPKYYSNGGDGLLMLKSLD